MTTDSTLAALVPDGAARHPDRELFAFEGRRVTYGEFERRTRAVAQDLIRHGIGPGDRVLVQLPNRLEALVLQIAALRAGAVGVPVVPIYRRHEMRQIVRDCAPAVVCTVATLGDRAPATELDASLAEAGLGPTLRYLVDGERPGWRPVPETEPTDEPLPAGHRSEDTALLLYTSGTTAAPKGALLSHRAVLTHLVHFRAALGLGEETVTLAATPLSHLAGVVAAVVLPAFVGGRSVIMSGWRPDDAVETIAQERVTLMMGATVFVSDLVEHYAGRPADTYRLPTYACAGSTIAPELVDRAAETGVAVVRAYGMTETAGVLAIASASDPLERRRSWDGRLQPGAELQAVDDDGTPVPPGELGRFRIRGPQLFDGYTDPVATAGQLDEEGWFLPGDVGRVDDEGWVQMVGRTKDIVNRGGEKFSTADIELVVASCPGVRRVAVTAIPDARLGEAVGAWVVLDDAGRTAGPEPLVRHLRESGLAPAKTPVEWHVVDAIPVTASGKVRKNALADVADVEIWPDHRPAGTGSS